ncbi:MAG: TonB-dependent receptor domain-containing protein [Coraliomargaritaceae bacterium]
MSDDVYELNDFVVTADDVLAGRAELIEIRAASVGQVDFLSSEDFAKFGGSNIADLVSRLAGVNVVEGQFAVVRGLGDRYNSTLLNDLPVPSPDPIRQGVQLDLFPTSIIESVVADKAFLPGLPSNSSGAAFNLITRSYPEEFTAWLETGFSVNENAKETLLVNPNAEPALGSPGGSHFDVRSILGTRDDSLRDSFKAASSTNVESDFFDFGGQSFKFGLGDSHEDPLGGIVSRIGYVGSFSYSSSSETVIGSQRDQFAQVSSRSRTIRVRGRTVFVPGRSGTLLTGDLPVSGLEYDLVNSTVKETTGFLFGAGVELDDDGDHKLNFTFLRSQSIISEAVRRNNGLLPDGISGQSNDRGFGSNGDNQLNLAADIVGRGGFDAFSQGQDILTLETRTLNARQVSGEHKFTVLGKDVELSWGLTESDASSEIGDTSEDGFVAGQSTLLYMQNVSGETLLAGPSGQLTEANLTEDIEPGAILFGGSTAIAEGFAEDVIRDTARSIDDEMLGKRIDGSVDLFDFVTAKGGFFMSETTRVAQQTDELLVLPSSDIVSNSDGLAAFAAEANDVANVIPLISSADVVRDIEDYYFQFDVDPIENLEVSLGARQSSVNLTASGSGQLFPLIGLFGAPSFLDSNIAGNQDITNGELIGYTEPGEGNIDENYLLPAVSIKYSFWDNWTFRASYGETIALPSSRELSPIFTLDTLFG